MSSKDKLLKEVETIRKALGDIKPEPEPINWEYYLSQEEIDLFRSMKPKIVIYNKTGHANFSVREQEFLNKLANVYIKERGEKRGDGDIH